MKDEEQALRDAPHFEIKRTDVRQVVDADLRDGITPAVKLLREVLSNKEQESFVILIINSAGRITAWREVARGRQDRVEVPTRELFRAALMMDAAMLIISHNHPSGDPTPSEADKLLTMRLRAAGEMISMPILDHIIIGEGERYFSMAKGEAMSTATMNVSGDREPPEF